MDDGKVSLYVQGPFGGIAIGPNKAAIGGPQDWLESASVLGVVEDMEAVNLRGQDGAVGYRLDISADDLVRWHVMAALHVAGGDAGAVDIRVRGGDEDESNEVSCLLGPAQVFWLFGGSQDGLEDQVQAFGEALVPEGNGVLGGLEYGFG